MAAEEKGELFSEKWLCVLLQMLHSVQDIMML